ncbi:Cupredoxin [Gymnopilus junonius]|uniref:Cupredoxin n=1 Tax=Gymnopilus junonius TaxID=109634 RepID=A0A9P5NAU5_GYMJU|nr:Cupredoxin [Gymnopilus junonius]
MSLPLCFYPLAKMGCVSCLFLCISAILSIVSATQFNVTVGKNDMLTFDPAILTDVQTGDVITFTFVSNNHSVTQSTFRRPCHPRIRGANSGFMPVDPKSAQFPEFTIHIDNTSGPLWFFCAQNGHCQAGMVFAINPTENTSFEDFLASAQMSANTTRTAATPAQTAPSSGAVPKLSIKGATTLLAVFAIITGFAS